jgi:hypothetical protein
VMAFALMSIALLLADAHTVSQRHRGVTPEP